MASLYPRNSRCKSFLRDEKQRQSWLFDLLSSLSRRPLFNPRVSRNHDSGSRSANPLSRWPFSSSCFWRPCSFTPANDKRWINIQATSSFFHFYPHLALFKYPFASICSLPDVVDAKDLASMHLRAAFVRAPPPARAQSLSMVNKNRWSTLCR